MDFVAGDRVIATENLGGFFGSRVPKGTKGVVVDVSGFFSASMKVRFDNNETEDDIGEKQIAKI